MKPSRVVLAALALLAVIAGVFLLRESASDSTTNIPDPRNGAPRLVAVDAHGAIIQSPDETWGVDRDGVVAWRVEATEWLPLVGVCDGACPRAVLSSDTNTLNSPLAEDPAPVGMDGEVPSSLEGKTGGKSLVLALSAGTGLRYSTDQNGEAYWTSLRSGSPLRTPAPAGYVDWFPTSDSSSAVAAIDTADGRHQQVWRIGKSGWELTPTKAVTTSGFGCVSDHARYAFVDGARLVGPGHEVTRLSAKPDWSNCGFTKDRLVVASYRISRGAAETTVAIYALDGQLVDTQRYAAEMALATDVMGTEFALIGDGAAQTVSSDGAKVDRIPEVIDARYDPEGNLVTLSKSGDVRWH